MNKSLNAISCLMMISLVSCMESTSTPLSYPTYTPDSIQAYVDANASQSTAIAAIATADFFASQLTATAESRNQIATQQIISIQSTQQAIQVKSTERSWNATTTADSIQSSVDASSTASAIAVQAGWTQRAMDITATADTASVQAFATKQYSIARTEQLSLERKELMNNVAAIVPWAMLVITFVLIVFFFKRWTRVRIIQRDPRGDAPLMLDVVDGVAYDADRHPSSTGGILREDIKLLPKFSSSDHTNTTTRDQTIDLENRGFENASGRKQITKNISGNSLLPNSSTPKIQVVDASQAKPLFHDVIPQIMQDAIEAEIILDSTEGEQQ